MSEPYRMAPEDFKRYVTSACRAGDWQNLADLIVQYIAGQIPVSMPSTLLVADDTRPLVETAKSLHQALIVTLGYISGDPDITYDAALEQGRTAMTSASEVLAEYGVLESETLDKPECLTDEDNA